MVFCALLLLSLSGCQPQSQNGGGLFGQRTPFGNNGTFGAQANSTFSGSSFNNPFARRGTNPSGLPQLGQSGNNGPIQGQLQQPGMAREYDRINQQLGAFDADNQLLNTEVATLKQKLELANQYNQTLKQQLTDTSDRINRSGNQQRINEQQFASMRQENEQLRRRITEQDRLLAQRSPAQDWQGQGGASGPFRNSGFSNNRGSATIRANNGLMQKFNSINIPGGDARMDGDIIRIEFPTDRLFASGSYQVQRSQLPLLQNVASTIRQSFPNQIVGIEAHWDGTPLNPPGTTDHQLTATQSLAVLDELVRLGLPSKQLFNMALGSNRPRHRQQMVAGVSPNRRIELVIYPESYDGR
jgi:flagellar motor protein MotB